MEIAEGLPERIEKLVHAAGSQRTLARILDVSDGTIIGWLDGVKPFPRNLEKIAERANVSLEWIRDGAGDEENEIERFRSQNLSGSLNVRGQPPSMECPMIASGSGPMAIVERTAMRLEAHAIASTISDVLRDPHVRPEERNATAKRLAAALLKKLDAEGREHVKRG
jgi:hypothetical protein